MRRTDVQSSAAVGVDETAGDGTVVGTATATGQDTAVTFALTDDAGGQFSIDTNTGDISLNVAGTPAYSQQTGASNPFDGIAVGDDAHIVLVDLDGDGDLDAFAAGNDGSLPYYENTGTATNPTFGSPVTNPFGLTSWGDEADPTFADLDGDGDLDAFVGYTDGNTRYFENTGSASSPSFAAGFENPFGLVDVGSESAPTFVDIDGDGGPRRLYWQCFRRLELFGEHRHRE